MRPHKKNPNDHGVLLIYTDTVCPNPGFHANLSNNMEADKLTAIKEKLDRAHSQHFNQESFLEVDPCGIVYELKEHTDRQLDIELGALMIAMITWGNRKAIRQAARRMLRDEMQWHPADFILSGKYTESYKDAKNGCVYRTLNREKFILVCDNIRHALTGGNCHESTTTLEMLFQGKSIEDIIATLCQWLSPAKLGKPGISACKRICMYLRWMIRQNEPDLGLWTTMDQRNLYAVMDIHVCQLTSSFITRKQADWKACVELTGIFRSWSQEDPLKYDLALMTVADYGF